VAPFQAVNSCTHFQPFPRQHFGEDDTDAGGDRVLRRGAWDAPPAHCRAARRIHRKPSRGHAAYGFRVVQVPPSAGGARP
jgi:formylglycine-generating enzyme required for sulfatase activity